MGQRCQSYGMPLSKDPKGDETEADGTLSTQYCSICYNDGAFVHQGVSAEEFQHHCVQALTDKGMPRIMAWLFTRGIPKLDRWQGRGA